MAVLRDGNVALDVRDRWALGSKDAIDMDWRLVMSDVRAEVPDDMPRLSKVIAVPLGKYLNRRTEPLEFSFRVKLDDGKLSGSASASASRLWDAVATELLRAAAKAAGIDPSKLQGAAEIGVDLFKGFLRRRRDKK